jgi:hypothetical protein
LYVIKYDMKLLSANLRMKRFCVKNTISLCFSSPYSGHCARNILTVIMMLHHFQSILEERYFMHKSELSPKITFDDGLGWY